MLAVINISSVITVLFLIFMEGLLSMDNALVLAITVRHLRPPEKSRALYYGIIGAFVFRFCSLFFLNYMMHVWWLSVAASLYLLSLPLCYFTGVDQEKIKPPNFSHWGFWTTVLAVEALDAAFSIDSILASAAMTQSYIIAFIGGCLGIIMMRGAASLFGKLIDVFPKLESTAYMLITCIGTKLFLQGLFGNRMDFHSSESPYAWAFWISMLLSILSGFRSKTRITHAATP
jgi:YkoY family integral membrane protein